jgi:carbonic anhydrase/acetyltransferase-like protein (isoleucine patch superfamily)
MSGLIVPFNGVRPRIAEDAFIAENAVIIGDVEIAPGASIWYGCVVRGDVNRIRIGRNTNIQDGSVIHVNSDRAGSEGGEATHIGDSVTVGHMVLLHACTVEEGAFIGMRAVVMDKAVVEARAMVAAGALVTPGKRIRSGELWAGSPARRVRTLGEEEYGELAAISELYARLAAEYRGQPTGAD